MHYEVVVSRQDLLEFDYNSREVHTNLWISQLPTFNESIGYEIRQAMLVVKFEENEDGRITYGNPSYTLQQVTQTIALACAKHRVSHFVLGASVHTIHVSVNEPQGAFIAKQGKPGVGVIKHQAAGLVFVKEGNFFMALENSMVAALYVNRMSNEMSLRLIPSAYLVRFEGKNGEFHYFPLSHVFADPDVRDSYLFKETETFDWDGKRKEIEDFVEDWTK